MAEIVLAAARSWSPVAHLLAINHLLCLSGVYLHFRDIFIAHPTVFLADQGAIGKHLIVTVTSEDAFILRNRWIGHVRIHTAFVISMIWVAKTTLGILLAAEGVTSVGFLGVM